MDWYISSVTDDPPVWTEDHISELIGDFHLIPRNDEACQALEQESCENCVSRQAVISTIYDNKSDFKNDFAQGFFADRIRDLQPVTPQPKTGRWIAYEVQLPDRTILNYRCSICGRRLIGYNTETLREVPFCHCGARMYEPQEIEGEK